MEFNFKEIHIGKLIAALVKEREIELNRIIKFFKDEHLDLENIYNSAHMNTDELLKWSKLLKYDLFRVYSQHLLLYATISNSSVSSNVNKKEEQIPNFPKSIYTMEIIEFIVDLLKTNKMTINEVIDQYKIPRTTLYRWKKKYDL